MVATAPTGNFTANTPKNFTPKKITLLSSKVTIQNEIAQQSGVGIHLEEAAIPVKPEVEAACELLGLDPLNIANEGKLIAICAAEDAEKLLAAMRAHPQGAQAAIVGRVVEDASAFVQMKTRFGGRRMVDWLSGEQLPRIC